MRSSALLCVFALILLPGCTVITYNRVFPKPAFVWSREAIEQRAEERAYKHLQVDTNSPAY